MTTPTAPATRTAHVKVRHAANCKDKARGGDWRRCNCQKSLRIYEGGGTGANRYISAKTRSWEKAEKFARDWLDSFDPDKQELKLLRAAKERKQVRIEEAVSLFLQDMIARLGDNGTVAMARSLFGHVDPQAKAKHLDGHLFAWLATLPTAERPAYISEITPAHLTAWRASWTFGDLTSANRWGMIRGFFSFCEAQGWIADSPARRLKRSSIAKGNRTAVFTDDQYAEILDAVSAYKPENVPVQTRASLSQRLTTFLELLRWSGMALIDAVQFKPDMVDSEGVLHYRRQKTGELGIIPLPAHVVALVRSVPLEARSNPEQPFRNLGTDPKSDTRKWQHRLCALFDLAGIEHVETQHGVRKPHPHMLRDTFAVSALRCGASLRTVSKMLGHSKTTTTEAAYLPWAKELETAHVADARKALMHAVPQPKGKVVAITGNR